MEFRKYMHIERLGNPEVNGILDGKVYVFSKIDGTSFSIWNVGNRLMFGSSKRVLDIIHDNQGFMATMLTVYKEQLQNLFAKYNVTLYGEFAKPHSIRYYKEDAWNKPYVYDVWDRNNNKWLTYEEYVPILEEFSIEYIPVIGTYENFNDNDLQYCLQNANFLLPEDKFGRCEGTVIKRYDFVNCYGRTTWAKVVQSEFMEKAKRDKISKVPEIKDYKSETEFVDQLSEALIEKEIWKFINAKEEVFNKEWIGQILEVVYNEMILEEFDGLNTEMYIGIDIRKIKTLAYKKIKDVLFNVVLKKHLFLELK